MDDTEKGVTVCCCCILILLIVFFIGGESSDHENSSTDININETSNSGYTSSKNPSTSTSSSNVTRLNYTHDEIRNMPESELSTDSSSNSVYTGYQEIVIEDMVLEDDMNIANRAGFGYIGTLIPKGKPYIIKLYEYDWNEIMRQTNGRPIGKTIYVDIEHDDFEEQWDGDDFYYIESF